MSRAYPARPIVGIGLCVIQAGAVLLVRRGQAPGLGAWSLPGGAQELGETAQEAARRETREETGVEAGPLLLAAVADSIHRDAGGRVEYHYTIIDFCAHWHSGQARAGSDVTELGWAPVALLDPYGLDAETRRVITLSAGLLGVRNPDRRNARAG